MKLEDMNLSIEALMNQPSDRRFRITSDNEWRLRKSRELEHRRTQYRVDLDQCGSSAEVLDWILQVFKKNWCSEKTLRDLVLQLELNIDPQGTLCSCGFECGPKAKKAGSMR